MSVHPKKLSRELLWRHRDLRRQEFSNWIYDRKNGISATVNPRNVYSNHLELWTAICHAGPPVWYRGAFGKCWDSRRGREGGREGARKKLKDADFLFLPRCLFLLPAQPARLFKCISQFSHKPIRQVWTICCDDFIRRESGLCAVWCSLNES